jgi:hypothetical protein
MLFEAKTLKLATRVIFVFLQCYFFIVIMSVKGKFEI